MKKLEIHPEALSNFNYKINSLINKLELKVGKQIDSKYNPQFYNVQELDRKKIIGDVIKSTIDEYGSENSKSFLNEKGSVGLFDLNYKDYEKICEGIQKLNSFKNIISLNTVKELVFKWMIKKCKDEFNLEPLEYLINECQIEIKEWEIITPIAELYIENEFDIGNVKLKTLSKEIIDGWESFYIKNNEGNNKVNREVINHNEEIRKSYSGKAATSYIIEAELDRAIEIANEEVDKTLSILRYFSRANVVPNLISCCTISGDENIKIIKNLILENGLLVRENVNIGGDYLRDWVIRKNDLDLFYQMGLEKLSNLLKKDTLNDFESTLLDSLLIYSKNCLMKNIHDKIIYILSSLESILINGDEPIMQNLSERVAILIGKDITEKKQIISNIKVIYGLRSKFLHHGHQALEFSQKEDVITFLANTHLLYAHLIGNMDFFKSKEHLMEFILDKKLSG